MERDAARAERTEEEGSMSNMRFWLIASNVILACVVVILANISAKLGRIAVALESRGDAK